MKPAFSFFSTTNLLSVLRIDDAVRISWRGAQHLGWTDQGWMVLILKPLCRLALGKEVDEEASEIREMRDIGK